MTGETVTIITKSNTGKDAFSNPITSDIDVDINNVLVQPVSSLDITDGGNRPDGDKVAYRLMLPKAWVYNQPTIDLRSSEFIVRGKRLKAIGNPGYFDDKNTPTEWCMSVNVEAIDG